MMDRISFTVPAVPVPQPRQKTSVTDDMIVASYSSTQSVWATGKALGLSGQCVYERLVRLGVKLQNPRFSPEDWQMLREEYVQHRKDGKLHELATKMGRTKQFICRKARELGLTSARHDKPWHRKWKGMTEQDALPLWKQFKKSRLGVGQFCAKYGFDDLGFSRTMRELFADEWDHVIELKNPKQTKYRLGRSVEYAVRDDLKKRGYFALRSPRSGGALDVIGIKPGCVLVVQCKRGMCCSVKDWNALFDLAVSIDAIPLLAGRPSGHGIEYVRMLDRKDGTKRRQPMESFSP